MVVADQHPPLLQPTRDTMNNDFASTSEPNSRAGASKHIGSGVDRIGQQPMNRMVARRTPLHALTRVLARPALRTVDRDRQVDPLLPQP